MKFLLALSVGLFASPAQAQINPPGHSQHSWPAPPASNAIGPIVPCYGCEDAPPLFDAPSSGLWENPLEPGTGFTLAVQGSLLSGIYYGYDEQGHALWYKFSGQLERPQVESRLLRLTATLEGTVEKKITLEFDQRNYGAFSINDGSKTNIVPVIEGIDTARFFPEYADYDFPDMRDIWTIVFENKQIPELYSRKSYTGWIPFWTSSLWTQIFLVEGPSYDLAISGVFDCTMHEKSKSYSYPYCYYSDLRSFPGGLDTRLSFPLPYANIGTSRIVSVNPETGIHMRAFRSRFD